MARDSSARRLAGRLAALGHDLVSPDARPCPAAPAAACCPRRASSRADVNDPAALDAVLAGCSVVVNLVGILNEHGRDGAGFEAAHAELARKLVAGLRALPRRPGSSR